MIQYGTRESEGVVLALALLIQRPIFRLDSKARWRIARGGRARPPFLGKISMGMGNFKNKGLATQFRARMSSGFSTSMSPGI
jgi:hypothetical protein